MLYGVMANGQVIVAEGGRPIREAQPPALVPTGYVARSRWVDGGTAIQQVWDVEPEGGTPQQASLALARIQAKALPDDQAAQLPALFDAWDGGGVAYAAGDRVQSGGKLWKCLKAHTSQADWSPGEAASLWAQVLPGQGGTEPGEWAQPDSTNPYAKGDRVTHGGKTWESLVDGNVWEPGATGSESLWKEVAE